MKNKMESLKTFRKIDYVIFFLINFTIPFVQLAAPVEISVIIALLAISMVNAAILGTITNLIFGK